LLVGLAHSTPTILLRSTEAQQTISVTKYLKPAGLTR
jgi:hypothetical protein